MTKSHAKAFARRPLRHSAHAGMLALVIGLGFSLDAVAQSQAQAKLQAEAQAQSQPRVLLAPHRAVYDLVLDPKSPAKGIDAAKARIVFDFTGDACDGYQLNFRQVTALDVSEGGRRVIDSRASNFESGDGNQFRFIGESRGQGAPSEKTDGSARKDGNGYKVAIKQPEASDFSFGADVLFPSAQLKAVIRAALAGEATLTVPMYDGSDNGKQVYDTLSVIGKKIEGGPNATLEPSLRKPQFDGVARWPVTISYFKRGDGDITPSYRVSFEVFENGITRAIRLDYGDFVLSGDFSSLELMAPGSCPK